ncbi:MAG: ATP-binding cassette domain-containing protein [Oxalicibacterium faecigallinarum]|uniref:amino acid ABC transporter ATP-binding/permease protein n=1 Tax=Oxalicibacterium faecigallinarum TaxID=573741 RepID=UPI00280808E7|nr:ATP-binding cassette domain-containing protein [Oxalicibacterium faecigallinarum]MDQ7968612.1 ATP-binding cassette domain-containing protein [Oxalicibacterium faecigallinarum]
MNINTGTLGWIRTLQELRAVLHLFATENRKQAWLGAGVAALTVLSGMALLGLSGWFITATAIAGLNVALAFAFDVFMPSAGIRLLAMGRTGLRYAERLVTHDTTLSVLARLRVRLFRGWAQPQAARRLLARPAQLLFRLTTDIDALDSVYLRIMVPMFSAMVAAVVTGIVLAFIQPWLGLAITVWLLVSGLGIALVVAWRARHIARLRYHALEALRARSIDLVSGQGELLMHGQLQMQCEKLQAADARIAEADDALNHLESLSGMAYVIAGAAMLCGTLLTVAALVEQGNIDTPVAALALLLVLTATEPFATLRRGSLEWGRTLLAAKRLANRIDQPLDQLLALPPSDSRLAIDLREVDVHPDDSEGVHRPYLQHLSLSVQIGERVAVIGHSGAGKSTLMALIAGELSALRGQRTVVPHTMLNQRTELFQDSVRDNLLLADPHADDPLLWRVLAIAGLAETVAAMPQGLHSRLGEGGFGLSGGQARRLALARVLLRDVPLWLLDEPTEGLDQRTAKDVLTRLQQALAENKSRTILMATHVRREAELADRIVRMHRGVIVADVRPGDPLFDALLASLRSD